MTKTEYYNEEDRPLLVLALDSEKFRLSQPVCETAVTRGTVNYLGQWPAHVLAAFIAGCLVFATFVLFGVITVILSIPLGAEKCRIPLNTETDYLPNVYFIKHENRSWSSEEFCYIETTARAYKNLSIYLINLLDADETGQNLSEVKLEMKLLNQDDESVMTRRESLENQRREKLGAFNSNIKNIDVPIQRFFNGSRLARICNHLNEDMIEMAAKAYVLWNFPGVALDPKMYPNLEFLKEYLMQRVDDDYHCGKYGIAAIELNGNIQASFLPCQAFLDHLIKQISMNESADQEYALKKAISDFCPRSSRCQGVKLLNRIQNTEFLEEKLNCPTIISANGVEEGFKG